MTPTEVIAEFKRLDKKSATIVVAGLAMVAAAAIVIGWKVDVYSAGLAGLYIVILGSALLFLRHILTDRRLKAFVSWVLVILPTVYTLTLFLSVVLQPNFIPPKCLIHFWDNCAIGEPVRNASPESTSNISPASISEPVQEADIEGRWRTSNVSCKYAIKLDIIDGVLIVHNPAGYVVKTVKVLGLKNSRVRTITQSGAELDYWVHDGVLHASDSSVRLLRC